METLRIAGVVLLLFVAAAIIVQGIEALWLKRFGKQIAYVPPQVDLKDADAVFFAAYDGTHRDCQFAAQRVLEELARGKRYVSLPPYVKIEMILIPKSGKDPNPLNAPPPFPENIVTKDGL